MEEIIDVNIYYEYLKTQSFGHNVQQLEQVDSTIDYLSLNDNLIGSIVLAKQQSNGRGRNGRVWVSNEDSLTFSILLPIVEPHKLMPLNIIMGYALCDAISLYAKTKLKWPNDCVINNKKVCGMLLEVPFEGCNISKVILGVGINLFNKSFHNNTELSSRATSIILNTDKRISKEYLLANIMNKMEEYFVEYTNGKLDIVSKWKDYSAFIGKEIHFHKTNSILHCIEKGINDLGEILVEHNAICENINIGEIGYDFSR